MLEYITYTNTNKIFTVHKYELVTHKKCGPLAIASNAVFKQWQQWIVYV